LAEYEGNSIFLLGPYLVRKIVEREHFSRFSIAEDANDALPERIWVIH